MNGRITPIKHGVRADLVNVGEQYARLNEGIALKRKLMEQEMDAIK